MPTATSTTSPAASSQRTDRFRTAMPSRRTALDPLPQRKRPGSGRPIDCSTGRSCATGVGEEVFGVSDYCSVVITQDAWAGAMGLKQLPKWRRC